MLGLLRSVVLVTLIGSFATSVPGEEVLVTEIVPIGHRPPTELLSILAPLVTDSGSLSATNDHLIVTTTRDNLGQIKDILAAIDHPLRNLLVSIRYGPSGAAEHSEGSASVRMGSSKLLLSTADADAYGSNEQAPRIGTRADDPHVAVQLWRTQAAAASRREQHLRVIDGAPACIAHGKLVPLGRQNVLFIRGTLLGVEATTASVNLSTGFCVVPHLRSGQVLLDIAPQIAHASLGESGSTETKTMHTTISVPLGRWVEIGGIGQRDRQRQSGRVYLSTGASEAVFVKVDEISP